MQMDYEAILELESILTIVIPPKGKIKWNLFGYIPHRKFIESIGLYDKGLNQLPPKLTKLENLLELFLAENEFTEITNSWKGFHNLKELHLKGNRISKIADIWDDMHCLQKISLEKNQLTSLHHLQFN